MKNILIMTSEYIGVPLANGICMKNIVRCLRKSCNEVYILCYQPDTEIVESNTFTVPAPINELSTRPILIKKMDNIKKMMLLVFRPKINKKVVKAFELKALDICKSYGIDTVVATYNPIETVIALSNIKKELKKINTVIYELDSYGDGIGITSYEAWKKAFNRLCRKNYSIVDHIIIMQSHVNYWYQHFGTQYGAKMKVADIPMLLRKPQINMYKQSTAVSMIYTGNISKQYRSPSYLLSVLTTLKEQRRL